MRLLGQADAEPLLSLWESTVSGSAGSGTSSLSGVASSRSLCSRSSGLEALGLTLGPTPRGSRHPSALLQRSHAGHPGAIDASDTPASSSAGRRASGVRLQQERHGTAAFHSIGHERPLSPQDKAEKNGTSSTGTLVKKPHDVQEHTSPPLHPTPVVVKPLSTEPGPKLVDDDTSEHHDDTDVPPVTHHDSPDHLVKRLTTTDKSCIGDMCFCNDGYECITQTDDSSATLGCPGDKDGTIHGFSYSQSHPQCAGGMCKCVAMATDEVLPDTVHMTVEGHTVEVRQKYPLPQLTETFVQKFSGDDRTTHPEMVTDTSDHVTDMQVEQTVKKDDLVHGTREARGIADITQDPLLLIKSDWIAQYKAKQKGLFQTLMDNVHKEVETMQERLTSADRKYDARLRTEKLSLEDDEPHTVSGPHKDPSGTHTVDQSDTPHTDVDVDGIVDTSRTDDKTVDGAPLPDETILRMQAQDNVESALTLGLQFLALRGQCRLWFGCR